MICLSIDNEGFHHYYFSEELNGDIAIFETQNITRYFYASLSQKKNCIISKDKNTKIKHITDKHLYFSNEYFIINYSIKNKFKNNQITQESISFDILMTWVKNLR